MKQILVTGGSGFIGSALCRHLVKNERYSVLNLDALTYAANPKSLECLEGHPGYTFVHGRIEDTDLIVGLLTEHEIDTVFHLAAESHVDRSITGPAAFLNTNVMGTYSVLEGVRTYLGRCPEKNSKSFRYVHVSTDEVYGDLGPKEPAFNETTAYDPSSPYSASKAASDFVARAWARTYGLPVLITNCSNNYGPCQFPEKLIPLMIINSLQGNELPVYGDGLNIRDWLYVGDHVQALEKVALGGQIGGTYNIGGNAERTNLQVIRSICDSLEELRPRTDGQSYFEGVRFVRDRPGHDRRYAINSDKITSELDWTPGHCFETGLKETISWYINNQDWWVDLVETSEE